MSTKAAGRRVNTGAWVVLSAASLLAAGVAGVCSSTLPGREIGANAFASGLLVLVTGAGGAALLASYPEAEHPGLEAESRWIFSSAWTHLSWLLPCVLRQATDVTDTTGRAMPAGPISLYSQAYLIPASLIPTLLLICVVSWRAFCLRTFNRVYWRAPAFLIMLSPFMFGLAYRLVTSHAFLE